MKQNVLSTNFPTITIPTPPSPFLPSSSFLPTFFTIIHSDSDVSSVLTGCFGSYGKSLTLLSCPRYVLQPPTKTADIPFGGS